MTCLTESQIQSVVDREATGDVLQHVATCASCAERVHTRARASAELAAAFAEPLHVPAHLARRVESALASADSPLPRRGIGATRLRHSPARHWPRAAWGGGAVAAATLIAVLFIAPLFKGPATVSATEILAASASRLAAPAARGVELLKYELVLDGVPKELMPDQTDGTYHIWKAIDHDRPGRFLFGSFGSDGRLISSISQDPALGRRAMLMTVEGQPYRFDTTIPSDSSMSLPELERLHMQAVIAMMQARGDQLLQVIDTPDGRKYQIEVPPAGSPSASPVWDLTEARVVVDADDYRVEEFAVSGVFLKQPYRVSYKLTERGIGTLAGDPFTVPAQPGQIELSGEGSVVPAHDAMLLALREIARLRQAR